MTTDPKDALPPRLDPACTCVCHSQPGVMHIAPCCREADPKDAEIARYDFDLMESRMVKDQWGGEWVRHSDHAAEIARLRQKQDGLDAAWSERVAALTAEIARLSAANEQLQYIAAANQTRAETAETERDEARGKAALNEGWAVESEIQNAQLRRERGAALAQVAALREVVTFHERLAVDPAALSRCDAQMRAEGRKEGLREAADVCVCIRQDPETAEEEAIGAMMCASAILAAAEKEGSGELL